MRVIIAETGKFPEIGKMLYDNAINKIAERLAKYLEKIKELGIIDCSNTKLSARIFMSNIIAFIIADNLIYTKANEFTKDEIIKNIVNTFENGIKVKK